MALKDWKRTYEGATSHNYEQALSSDGNPSIAGGIGEVIGGEIL
jgi:hypothetical protein